ncbi:hypothetical protein P7C70_g5626, partial [Phenoliferia sp. Uapishka_3]
MSTPSPRASLCALPLELKTTIVMLVAHQDVAYRARLSTADSVYEEEVKEDVLDGYGKSLSILRLLNREFCELGARHQFSTISARRAFDAIFRYHISNRYGSCVERINFSAETSSEHVSHIITCLDRFTNLRKLYFKSDRTVDQILGDDWYYPNQPSGVENTNCCIDPDFAFSAKAFRQMALRIEHLDLDDDWDPRFTPGPFLKLFPGLKSLTLTAMLTGQNMAPHLASALKSLTKLEFLGMTDWRHFHQDFYTAWPSTCALRRISIRAETLLVDQWKMVEALGPHLEVLELDVDDFASNFSDEFPTVINGPIIFPRLKELDFKNIPFSDNAILPFLSRFTTSSIFNLHIKVGVSDDPLPTLFQQLPHLKSISIDHSHHHHPAHAEQLHYSTGLCVAKGIVPTLESKHFSCTSKADLVEGPFPLEAAVGAAAVGALNFAAIRRALNFGLYRLQRAELDGEYNWDLGKAMVDQLERLRKVWAD